MRSVLASIVGQEDINFFLTNRLPRRTATRFIGWFSKIENPIVSRASIAAWKLFADLDLSEAATTDFRSMHACFTRQLKPGARPTDARPDVLVSPCDAIVGACGRIEGDRLYQVKGLTYTLADLLGAAVNLDNFRNGRFVTLRLTSSMYHRFHAPHDLSVQRVTYISGDTCNVNPVALKRVQKLFCKNERAIVECRLEQSGQTILLVPVAAILVASIRFHFCDIERKLRDDPAGVFHEIACSANFTKGQEMGWFEHGSTIIVFAPPGFVLADGVDEGTRIKVGQPLMRLPTAGPSPDDGAKQQTQS
jgi:phosphatidylserine decarboxylase